MCFHRERSDELERRVISADCQLCGSLLTLLQQDLAGYMKGAWALRRAWKAYRSTHSQILRLYRDAFRDDGESAGSVGPGTLQVLFNICLFLIITIISSQSC